MLGNAGSGEPIYRKSAWLRQSSEADQSLGRKHVPPADTPLAAGMTRERLRPA